MKITAKPSLTESLNRYLEHVKIARPFVEEYGDKLPPYTGTLYIGIYETPTFEVRLMHRDSRDHILAMFGDAFGRTGWTGKLGPSGYDWKKQIGGVVVKIEGAETLPVETKEFSVSPNKFPLQLTETAA